MADQDGLLLRALQYEEGHPRRSGHILKVLALAGMIGREEGLSEEEQMILEAAAILHDIGIKHCKEKYGIASQELQKKGGSCHSQRIFERLRLSGLVGGEDHAVHSGAP